MDRWGGWLWILYSAIFLGWRNATLVTYVGALALTFAMSAPFVWFFCWVKLRKEAFAYTHYPMRLNRQTRMLHVFRLNGTVLSVPWDKLFFCIAFLPKGLCEIQAQVVADDGVTVLETIPFPGWHWAKSPKDQQINTYVLPFWEIIRRYMEEGAAEPAQQIKWYAPIADHKETILESIKGINIYTLGSIVLGLFVTTIVYREWYINGWDYLMTYTLILAYTMIPSRWFAIATSKIPQWPLEIEAQNVIAQNDPYKRDWRNNV